MDGREPPELFWEDMERKAEWFYETRGRLSDKQLSAKYHRALEQIERLREARTLDDLDPGGEAPKGTAATLTRGRKRARVDEVENPYSAATENFATAAVRIDDVARGEGALVKLRLRRGASADLQLKTARLFFFNEKTRQWNLVERSGYNARGRYVWGLAYRPGVYATVALPKDARSLALERFAFHYIGFGLQSGALARAADYFDVKAFRQLAIEKHELQPRQKADREKLKALVDVHRQSRQKLERSLRRQLPNGGPPEWHLIEHLSEIDPDLLELVEIGDLVGRFPWVFRLENRVGRWYPMGPRNINGRIKSIASHPTDGDTAYAGAANGGVWKTINGGVSWRSLWKLQDTMAVGSLAVAPSSPQTIYVATGEDTPGWGPSYGGVGVYKSSDGGTTWTELGSAASLGARCAKVVVHPGNPDIVYLASESGVYKSKNGGGEWQRVRTGHASDLVMAHDAPETLYAGIWNGGVYKTSNGGDTWSRIESEVEISLPHSEVDLPFPTGSAAGWVKLAIGQSGPLGSSLVIAKLGPDSATTLVSGNGGASWQPLGVSQGVAYDEWTSLIAINPHNPACIHVGGVGLQYTANGWQFQDSPGSHSDHHSIAYHPSRADTCWLASDGGVYRSTDSGASWRLASDGLQATQLLTLGVAQQGPFVVGASTQDQGVIQSEGASDWNDFGGGNEWGMFVVDPNNSNNIFISPGGGQLRRSTDRGRTYSNPTAGLSDWWASQNRLTRPASFAHVAVQPGNSNIVIGGATVSDEVKDADGNVTDSYPSQSRIYYSLNGGANWSTAFTLPSFPSRVAFASNGVRAYAVTNNGRFFRSDSCGISGWTEAATPENRPRSGYVTWIVVDPDEPEVVYITYSNGNPHVYRSEDGGAHWSAISGISPDTSLPDIAVSSLVVDPENDDVLYVATDIGVFRTNDGGATWYFYNDSVGEYDLPKVVTTGLGHHRSDNRLFAATLGRGLYYTYTSGIPRLRVLAISKWLAGRRRPGIEMLRVTDGSATWVMTRAEVIRRIEAGTQAYTRGVDGSRGEILVMQPDARHPRDYLKTTPDATTADNLLSLPEF